jgi:undecaprenyl-diphosphatase
MNPLEAALLGLLQGLTEFLPVSSSGHLVLGQALLGIHVPGVAFEVAVHVATLLAVLVVYRSRIAPLFRGRLRAADSGRRLPSPQRRLRLVDRPGDAPAVGGRCRA